MTDPILATHNLQKSFGALQATDNVSIDLYPGEIHAVIGPNGAGKSTLIAQICGELKPDAGRVELLGQDFTQTNTLTRAKAGIARTFQISALAMEDTVLQNVLLGAVGAGAASSRGISVRLWACRACTKVAVAGRGCGGDAAARNTCDAWSLPALHFVVERRTCDASTLTTVPVSVSHDA